MVIMRTFVSAVLFCVFSLGLHAQILNGAWRLVERNGQTVESKTVKLYSNGYYTWASYDSLSGAFMEAGGGTYTLDFEHYEERCEIDSRDPALSGRTSVYRAFLNNNLFTLNYLKSDGYKEVWEKIDGADDYEMTTCWRIHLKRDADGADWRTIEYAPRKTLKMLTNSRYQVLALNSHTGQFVGSSGGTWDKADGTYREHIDFFSKNPANVGRTLGFERSMVDGLWHHTGTQTDGDPLREQWMRYK